ncbi:integrase arm-type DNA-binding domain-containing protein [Orientia tsutsugamushi]|uniref:integrase arm-type DNA-binding domain-containing protein n=1 Tax=Orientia tsutsugamushi TaxID=784 RepID=UPI003526DE0A
MSSISFKLTKQLLTKIKIPEGETLVIIHHPDIIGLKLKISWVVCGGRVRKPWALEQKFKNQSLKITIGVFPDLSIKEASKIARELKTLMAKGIDPREVKRQQQIEENEKRLKARQDITFKQLCDKCEEYSKIYNTSSKGSTARIHNYGKPLFLKKINEVKRNDIEPIFNDISKEEKYATANLFLITLRTMFNKAIKWELMDRNPTLRIDKHKMQAR